MKKVVLTFLLLLSLAAVAQESQSGYNFLRLPVSAHVAALGGDNISLIEDDQALAFSNPALLSSVTDRTMGLNMMTYMAGATTASATYSQVVKQRGTWGVSGQYMDYGRMKEMDENNVQTGEFSAREIAVAGYYAYLLTGNLSGGITAKFVNSYIANYSSIAVGVDLGLNYYDPDTEWSVSAVAKNLGGQLKAFDDNYEKMPMDVQIGATKRFEGMPFRVSLTMTNLTHWNDKLINHFVAGVDIVLSENIWVGGGYNFRRASEMAIASGDGKSSHGAALSFGGGIYLERFKLNVAYAKYHASSSSLLVNVAYSL